MKITIISSSIRVGRVSHRVALFLRGYLQQQYASYDVQIADLQELNITPMNQVYTEIVNPPASLKRLYELLNSSDAIIFLSPEYNGSYSSALKNAVDYFSKDVFRRKPIGVVSISTGGMAGMRGALQMQQLVLALFGLPIPSMLLVPFADQKFNVNGKLLDENFLKMIQSFLAEYTWFAELLLKSKVKTSLL